MKLLIASYDAVIDSSTGKYFPKITDAFDSFLEQDDNNEIVVVSIDKKKLEKIDKKYNPLVVANQYRGSSKLIEILTTHLKCTYSDIIILGCKNHDVYCASNSKTLLLRASYAKHSNPDSIIYKNVYGLRIKNPVSLAIFFKLYLTIKTPWFYQLEVDEKTTLYALTEANTYGKSADSVELCQEFKDCLKNGNTTYIYPFTIYFLLSTYLIFKDLNSINYWGVFPTSDGELNEDLDFFLTKARQSFNSKSKEPLFIRHTKTSKRHKVGGKDERIADGCDSQFDTMIINPHYKNKLKGKNICIIDDFTTYGTSCETIRHLLLNAGVNKIVFIALGKFGHTYNKYEYEITGDVFDEYDYVKKKRTEITGAKNPAANAEFLLSINEMT